MDPLEEKTKTEVNTLPRSRSQGHVSNKLNPHLHDSRVRVLYQYFPSSACSPTALPQLT